MEEWAEIIRSEIKVQDFQNGWLSTHKRCCMGEQIYDLVTRLILPDAKRARGFCQTMIDQKIIENVEGNAVFNPNDIYRFYFDSDTVAENMFRTCWKAEPGEPLSVSIALV